MSLIKICFAILIYLALPLFGLIAFLVLVNRMKKEKVAEPPLVELFLIFATYDGLLMVFLTSVFWKWSGMASLGSAYLILVAPIVMGMIAYRNHKRKDISKYHLWTFWSGVLYFIITPLTLLTIVALVSANAWSNIVL